MSQTSVAWNNPYTSPPEGMAAVLATFPGLSGGEKDTGHPARVLLDELRAQGIWGYGLHVNLWFDAQPRRQLPEATKIRIRKLNAMRRFLKRYGFTARHFLDELYAARGWTWAEEDDQLFARAQLPPKQSKVQKLKRAARRKSENDALLKGTP